MSFEQLKREVALLSEKEKAELISFTLQLRYAEEPSRRSEINDRLNDSDKSRWLSPDEFEKRLNEG